MRSILILVVLASTAYAGEALRFGVTAGLKDPDAMKDVLMAPIQTSNTVDALLEVINTA